MNRTKAYTFAAFFVAGALSLAAPLMAHHSSAMFDATKTTELTGTVKEFQWTNPHVWVQVNVDKSGASGVKEEWSFEGGSPNTLSRQGWQKSTFAPGAQVTIRFNPMRDGTHAGQFVAAKFADGKTLGRWEAAAAN
jgi:Family of unknown function (DUF6152)